jgi:hypothetical protein
MTVLYVRVGRLLELGGLASLLSMMDTRLFLLSTMDMWALHSK